MPDIQEQNFPGNQSLFSEEIFGSGQGETKTLSTLATIDWDFKDAVTNDATHGFHPYPARFIPQLPRTLIAAFTEPGDVVYDPFVGCGTTCVEANLASRNALGNDVNGLAVLISRVKTHPLGKSAEVDANVLLQRIQRRAQNVHAGKESAPPPPSEKMRDWFEGFVIAEATVIKSEVDGLEDTHLRDFCRVALSAITVKISRQDSDTRYVRVPKTISSMDTVMHFERHLKKMFRLMNVYQSAIARADAVFKIADSRQPGIFPENSANFAVTSPPYPNAYDYHLYHRHRLLLLGMDPSDLKKKEIGAHAHYSKKNGLDASDFREDMTKTLRAVGGILKRGGYFAIIIGDSIVRGTPVDNAEIIRDASEEADFRPVAEFSRRLDSTKKSFHPSHGNIAQEKILILRNEKA